MEKKFRKMDTVYLIIIGILTLAVIGLSTWVIVLKKKKSSEWFNEYYADKCKSYEVQNANLSQGQIVFIGDSITDLFPLDSYFASLPLATYNRGISGDVTSGVLNRLKVCAYDIKPSKIVLMIGINDIDCGRSAEDTAETYKEILKNIKENLPETKVYCMSLVSQHKGIEKYSALKITKTIPIIMETNSLYQSLAQEFGYTYVDLFHETCDSNNVLIEKYSDDGLHLNANGFEVWANVLKPYLQ